MKTISREKIVYSLDQSHPPVLEIESGEAVLFETYDARTGTIQSDNDLLDHAHPLGSNPATGPVFIHNAEPGDSLAVEILRICSNQPRLILHSHTPCRNSHTPHNRFRNITCHRLDCRTSSWDIECCSRSTLRHLSRILSIFIPADPGAQRFPLLRWATRHTP